LFQYSTTGTSRATYVNSLVSPQTASGSYFAVSGEYGSSPEDSNFKGVSLAPSAPATFALVGLGLGFLLFSQVRRKGA
jgi:hypothetical protein